MKKKLWFFMIITLLSSAVLCAQASPAEQLAGSIADRLRDSLLLSTAQRSGIYMINMQLHEQKLSVRQRHAQSEWTVLIQRIENTRDSLYRPVLGEEKYLQYKQKKRALINNQ